MNFITLITLSLVVVLAGGKALSIHLTEQAKAESSAKYEQRAIDRDDMLTKACAAGQTGVVSYYKGVYCSDNVKG